MSLPPPLPSITVMSARRGSTMPRPRGKKPSQHYQTHRGTTSQQRTDERQQGNLPFDPQQYTNAREPFDDTESVEEVDGESIPDAFKRRNRVRSSHNGYPKTASSSRYFMWPCSRRDSTVAASFAATKSSRLYTLQSHGCCGGCDLLTGSTAVRIMGVRR